MTAVLSQEEADDIFDALQADIEAAAAKEAELEVVLTRLEELILEDILSGDYAEDYNEPHSGSVTPSTAAVTPARSEFGSVINAGDATQETFIQQKSLALLPLLCRFPLFTSSASNRLIKLIVLVSKRLNPKELWLGLDSVVETSRVGLEALAEGLDYAELSDEEGADDEESNAKIQNEDLMQDSPEHISIYLSRALLAIQIVIPRIRVKKPEKYLKPVLDALTGCFTALQSPELREQIVEPELFASSLLLVNTAKLIVDTWAWAQDRQPQPDASLKSALIRLYLLAVRSLLPLCPEASRLYSASPEGASAVAAFGRSIVEPCTALNVEPLIELEGCFNITLRDSENSSDWRNHVQRTKSHILLAPLALAVIQTTEEQSQTILRQLPGIFQLIMAEDHDELLRTVALQAAVFLGEAASLMPATREESNAFLDGDAVSPFYPSVQDVVEILASRFEDIEGRPPLSPDEPAPARGVLDLCEHLILHNRLDHAERDKLITMLLQDENRRMKTLAVNILRKLMAAEEKGQSSVFMDNLLQTFGKDVFTWRPLHAGDMHNLDVQAFTICLLNFIYVYNVRRGVSAASEDPIVAHFLTDICELLEAAAWLRDKPAEDFIPQQDTSTRIASQLQLELVKDAWRRATDSTYAGST